MSTNIPALPIAGATLVRAFLALLSLVTSWLKQFARARRNRRDAAILAGLDGRMLSDMGITRSDLSDAFSAPLWEDPTALLKDRARERRMYHHSDAAAFAPHHPVAANESGFHRPRTDRPASQTV
jgi:uncharacterized protein YjiS (DUF1127 family)